MPRSPVPFHVQHIARPAHIERILGIASDDQPFDPGSIRLQLAQEGYQVTLDGARRSLDMGGKLGLFEKVDRSSYTLTARGQACRSLALYRREVYCDVMHFLLFATWELGGHRDYWSWSLPERAKSSGVTGPPSRVARVSLDNCRRKRQRNSLIWTRWWAPRLYTL